MFFHHSITPILQHSMVALIKCCAALIKLSNTKYDSIDDKINGVVDEYETQDEHAGARYMIALSGTF